MLLLIDELNNLSALTESRSDEALLFGGFVRQNFLRKKGRCLVFSSHVISTVSAFGEFASTSVGSSRPVTLQELPLVDNLSTAMGTLNDSLKGTREAIYYGLLPRLIYETGRKSIEGKRGSAMDRYLSETSDKDTEFKRIVISLITGDLADVPELLHILLDGCTEVLDSKKAVGCFFTSSTLWKGCSIFI